jgi:AraC-like DNA-binding protein
MRNDLVIPLNQFFPEVKEFSHTKIHYAKPFVPSFEDKGWTSIVYIEKGNFEIRYETGEVLTPKGGTFYYHPPLSLKYHTYDKMITPYSMFRLTLDLSMKKPPVFSSNFLEKEIIAQLPSRPFFRKAPALLVSSFKTIIEEYDRKDHGWMVQIENSIRQILISAIRTVKDKEQDIGKTHWLVKKVDRFLDDKKEFMGPVEELFEQLGVSRSRGYDIFHQTTGLNPKEYIIRKKVELAKQMLIQNRDITGIAFDLGFSSSQSFATVFKKLTCTTPSDFKKKQCATVSKK